MAGYTLYFYRPDRSVPHFDFVTSGGDGDALRQAQRCLLEHPTAQWVEVFNGERIIGKVDRSQARPRPLLRLSPPHASAPSPILAP